MLVDDDSGFDCRFGKVAFKLGYVSVSQLQEALWKQVGDDLADRPHQLIGEIMLGEKMITLNQVEEVLGEMSKIRKGKGITNTVC